MLTPYVQDVSKWIHYYNRNGTSNVNGSTQNENASSSKSDSVGLAQESNMSVIKVEPMGQAPPAPYTGPSASIHNVTPTQESVIQAAYTAKRVQIEKAQTNGKRGRPPQSKTSTKKTPASGKVKKSYSNNRTNLFGTPADIFKAKNSKKKKSK